MSNVQIPADFLFMVNEFKKLAVIIIMAEDRNLLMRMDVVGDQIKTWVRGEVEWTDRHTNALLDVVLGDRFRNALFQRIVEDSQFRNEIHTRINNRESIAG